MSRRVAMAWIWAIAAACFLGPVVPALAQSEATVRGQLVAAADGSGLGRASVTLRSWSIAEARDVTSDADGRFVLPHVPPGEYVLSGVSEGFAPNEIRFVLEPREVKVVRLSLALRAVEVSVEVSGDAAPVSSTHSPSSTVLTTERIERMPLTQRSSLPETIVTLAPGMIRGHDDFVHVRGHEMALNPLVNGVSFWENPHALFSPGLSPMVIDTANVMTGGFPAEYGNRFGGVVDIVTKSGFRMQDDGVLSFGGGQAGRRNLSGEYGSHRGRFGYFLAGSMYESGRFLSPPDPEAIHDSGRGGHGFFQLDGNLERAGLLRVIVTGGGASFEIPMTPQDVALRPLARADQRTRQHSAVVSWNRARADLSWSATFYQRSSSSRLLPASGPLTAVARFDRDLLTVGGKVDVTRFTGRHAIKAGVDVVRLRPEEDLGYDYIGYRNLTHELGLPHIHVHDNRIDFWARESGGQVSAYVQDGIQIGDRVTADLGVRLDRYDLVTSATHASPRVNLAVQAGGGAVVHASYNRFFVPPPIEGVLSGSAGLTTTIREIGVALPALEPTIEDQLELGASVPAGPLHLALTGYLRATDNPVHTTVWPDSRIYSYASFDRARAYGLEARAEVPALVRYGVSGDLNYALGRVNFFNPVTGGFVTEAEHLTESNRFLAPMDQTHTLTAGATYRHTSSGTWIGTAIEYGSGTPMGHGGGDREDDAGESDHGHDPLAGGASRVPGHLAAHVSVGVDLLRDAKNRSRLSLQLDIENLTDHVYRIAQEGEFSPAQFSIPRLISATARVRF